jgi:hypothetical protein
MIPTANIALHYMSETAQPATSQAGCRHYHFKTGDGGYEERDACLREERRSVQRNTGLDKLLSL